MQLNICVNAMAPFGPYAVDVKGKQPLPAIAQNKVCPGDEMAHSPGTNVFSIERHVFVRKGDGLLSYRVELNTSSPVCDERNRVKCLAV